MHTYAKKRHRAAWSINPESCIQQSVRGAYSMLFNELTNTVNLVHQLAARKNYAEIGDHRPYAVN